MANESFANTLQVSIDGRPLAADVSTMLTQAVITLSRNLPDSCHLRFRDPERVVVSKTGLAVGSEVEVAVTTAEPGSPQRLMAGEVVAMEIDIDAAGSFLEVRGLDPAHRLFRGRRIAAYPNMGLGEVVRTVAQRAGLRPGTIDSVQGYGETADAQLSQDNISDWTSCRGWRTGSARRSPPRTGRCISNCPSRRRTRRPRAPRRRTIRWCSNRAST